MIARSETQRTDYGHWPGNVVKRVSYFSDKYRNPIPEEQATNVEVIEYNFSGQIVQRVYLERSK